jgi:hypothetical protein
MAISLPERAPAVESVGDAIADARAAVSRAAERAFDGLDHEQLAEAIAQATALESSTQALRLSLSAEADRRRVAEESADTGTDAWLAKLTGSTRAAMSGGLRLAGLLETKYAATREAFAAGRLRVEQVKVIVNAAEQAPPAATTEQVRLAEELLVARATGDACRSGRPMDSRRLRQAARRMFDCVDHDLADQHEAILLGREARSAEAETFLSLGDNGDGTYSGRFRISELHGHLLSQVLDQLTAPRRLCRDSKGRPIVDESAPGHDGGHNYYEARGAAFCELIEHLPTKGHGANVAEILVTMDLEALLTGLGTARLDTGTTITAGEARRLACNAGLVPVVLGTASMPLDVGRSSRLHTKHQRRGYAVQHDTCAISGCERPFAWCEIHHQRLAWSKGGGSDYVNGLPLCGHHHRRAHDQRFRLRQRSEGEWVLQRRT